MPGAIIVINQDRDPGPVSNGTPGIARNDLWRSRLIHLECATGGNTSYEWTLLSHPAGMEAPLIGGANTASATLSPSVEGAYRVMLTTNGGGPGNVQVLICAVTKDTNGVELNRGWVLPAYGEEAGEANWDSNESGWAAALTTILEDVRQNSLFLDTANGAANGDVLSWDGGAWVPAAGGGGGGNVLILDPTLPASAAPAYKTMTELLVARAAIVGPVEVVLVGAQATVAGTYDLTECSLHFRGDITLSDGTVWQNPYSINGGGYTLFNDGTGHVQVDTRSAPMHVENVLLSPTGAQAVFVTTGPTVWDFCGYVAGDGTGLPMIDGQTFSVDLRTFGPRADISSFDIFGSRTVSVYLDYPLDLSGFAVSYSGTKTFGNTYVPLVPSFDPTRTFDDSFRTRSLGELSYYLTRYKPACALFDFDGPHIYNGATGEVALYNSIELRGSTTIGQTQIQFDDNTYFHDAVVVRNLKVLANGSVSLFQFSSKAKLELVNSVVQSLGAHPVITLPHKSILIVDRSDINTPVDTAVGTIAVAANATVTVLWGSDSNIQNDVFVGPNTATLDVYLPPGFTFPTQANFLGTVNTHGGLEPPGTIIFPLVLATCTALTTSASPKSCAVMRFDPSWLLRLQTTSTVILHMVLATSNAGNAAYAKLNQITGTSSPRTVATSAATTATSPTDVTEDVSAFFRSGGSATAGLYETLVYLKKNNGVDVATLSGAWLEITI